MVGRGDEAGDLAGVLVEHALEGRRVVPRDAYEPGDVLGDHAVVAEALHPRRHAVVAALDGDDERAAGGRPGDHRRVVGHRRRRSWRRTPSRRRRSSR